MRLKSLIPTFLLSLPLLSPFVDARRRHKDSGHRLDSHEREIVSQRQYRPQLVSPRDLIDICINLDAVVDGNPLLEELFLGLHLCLCLKDLNIFLDTYLGLDVLGIRALVEAELKDFFLSQPACDPVPAHAHRECTTEDPCACSCDDGFTKVHGECVCPAPKSVCNGVCGNFPHGCGGRPSSLPRSLKKRAALELTFSDARAYCGEKRVCGVPGGSELAFECVDVKTSSDSCGGCLYEHPWTQPSQTSLAVRGQDCSSFSSPHALSHRCESSRCVVNTCAKGYIVGSDGCVPSSRIVPRMAIGPLNEVFSSEHRSLNPSGREEDCDCDDDGNGNGDSHPPPPPPTPSCPAFSSGGYGNIIDDLLGSLGLRKRSQDPCESSAPSSPPPSTSPHPPSPSPSPMPSQGSEPCPNSPSAPAPSSGSGSSSGDDIVVDLSPLAEADVDLGPGLNDAVNNLSGGLGLSGLIHPGKSVNEKRGRLSRDLVADLSPLTVADVDLGPALDEVVDGPAGGVGLGKVIYEGHVVNDKRQGKVIYEGNEKREEDCGCEDGDGDGSTGTASSPTATSPSLTTSPSPSPSAPSTGTGSSSSSGSGAGEGSSSSGSTCPSGSSSGSATPSSGSSSSGNDIVADLSPLAEADVNVGPGLNNAVTGLAAGLGLGKTIYPGHLVNMNAKREEDCDGNGSSGSSASASESAPPQPLPSPSSSGLAASSLTSRPSPTSQTSSASLPSSTSSSSWRPSPTSRRSSTSPTSPTSSPSSSSNGDEPCPSESSTAPNPSSGSGIPSSGDDLVVDLSPLAEADVNLGPGLDGAVANLVEGLGLGKVIYEGHLVNEKRKRSGGNDIVVDLLPLADADVNLGTGSDGAVANLAEGLGLGKVIYEGHLINEKRRSSSSGNDIVVDLLPLADADVNLGLGLDKAVTGLTEGLGLGKVVYEGQLIDEKRDENCDCEDGSSGSSSTSRPSPPTSSSTPSSIPSSPSSAPSAPSTGTGSGSGSSSTCPSSPNSSGTSPSSGSSSGSDSDIVADLSPLAIANANLGPGLNSAVTGLASGLGLGKVVYPGQLVNAKREEDCDGNGSSGSFSPSPSSPSPSPSSPLPPSTPSSPPPSSQSDDPCPDDSGSAPVSSTGNGNSSSGDTVVDLSPLAEADVNLGPGLNIAVNGLAEGLGLGSLVYPGHLDNA